MYAAAYPISSVHMAGLPHNADYDMDECILIGQIKEHAHVYGVASIYSLLTGQSNPWFPSWLPSIQWMNDRVTLWQRQRDEYRFFLE
jgi:hypothetical protein